MTTTAIVIIVFLVLVIIIQAILLYHNGNREMQMEEKMARLHLLNDWFGQIIMLDREILGMTAGIPKHTLPRIIERLEQFLAIWTSGDIKHDHNRDILLTLLALAYKMQGKQDLYVQTKSKIRSGYQLEIETELSVLFITD